GWRKRWTWASMRPGIRVAEPRSITVASAGWETCSPASVILLPVTRTSPGEMSFPAATSSRCAAWRTVDFSFCCAVAATGSRSARARIWFLIGVRILDTPTPSLFAQSLQEIRLRGGLLVCGRLKVLIFQGDCLQSLQPIEFRKSPNAIPGARPGGGIPASIVSAQSRAPVDKVGGRAPPEGDDNKKNKAGRIERLTRSIPPPCRDEVASRVGHPMSYFVPKGSSAEGP